MSVNQLKTMCKASFTSLWIISLSKMFNRVCIWILSISVNLGTTIQRNTKRKAPNQIKPRWSVGCDKGQHQEKVPLLLRHFKPCWSLRQRNQRRQHHIWSHRPCGPSDRHPSHKRRPHGRRKRWSLPVSGRNQRDNGEERSVDTLAGNHEFLSEY